MTDAGTGPTDDGASTADLAYAERLRRLDESPIRRALSVQAPYRWNIRRLKLGRTLDVGSGLGRNLAHLGTGVGIDHNPHSVAIARSRGLVSYTPDEFEASADSVKGSYDSMLLAHVAEHLSESLTAELMERYVPYVKPGGRLCLICPQEAGYKTDATHVRFVDFDGLRALAASVGATEERSYSFPFPRFVGKRFPYNEFVFVGTLPA